MKFQTNDAVTQNMIALNTAAVERNTAVLSEILAVLKQASRPPRPLNPVVTPIGEDLMADTLTYTVALAPLPSPTDVTKRRMDSTVDGAAQPTVEVGVADPFPNLAVPQGSAVSLSFTDVDDSGNISPATVFAFTATDTIPPDAPAGVTVTPVGETLS